VRRVFVPVVAGLLIGWVAATSPASGAGASSRTALPRPRADMAIAPDRNGNILLFGGYDGDPYNMLQDTWTWDGAAWTQQSPAMHPTPRCCYGMAYDAARGKTVLFGGTDDFTYFKDTWTWDGTTWTEQHPAHTPPGSANFGMVYDAAIRRVVAFMGEGLDANPWTWDGTDWTEVPAATQPDSRELEQFAYDGARKQVVMFGGEVCYDLCDFFRDTWTWDGTDWTLQLPQRNPRAIAAGWMAYDAIRRQTIMFAGGFGVKVGDTWIWDGSNWKRAHPSAAPATRERHAMAWDDRTGQIVLFGGRDYPQGHERYWNDTWTWDGTTWTEH
jgi:hypothetical protein